MVCDGVVAYLPAMPPAATGTGLVFHPDFLRHNDALAHPESPLRLTAIAERLASDGLTTQLRSVAAMEADDGELERVHTRRYLDQLASAGGHQLDPDTYCGPDTPRIARLAAGGVLAATRAVMRGDLANAFCAVRPPGHHALADRAMGFCFINNAAVAAADVVANDPSATVLILDWDVHHGNGTQAIFYESSSILYASTHQYPFYPGTGSASETGRGAGRGFTINKPLWAGSGDREFLDAISQILDESAGKIHPALVIISAGFDAHRDDPLAMLEVTVDGFVRATHRVCEYAREICGGRVVSVLEGGYNLTALAESVAAHVTVLLDAGTTTPWNRALHE
jgi:acetoin utilization deacetylase AcuC-like enzyme